MKQYDKIKRLRNKADKLWQIKGLELEPYCIVCGKKAHCRHHFIPKSLSSGLRHDIKNGISLCFSHHQKWHSTGDPELYEAMTSNKSAEWFEHIKANRRKEIKPSLKNYEVAIKELSKM